MNILHLIDSLDTGGAEKVVYYLATRMNEEIFNHHVAVLGEQKDTPISKALVDHRIPIEYINRKPGFDISAIRKIRGIAKIFNIDIIHGHNAGEIFGPLSAICTKIVVLTTIHGDFHHSLRLQTVMKIVDMMKKNRKVAVAKYLRKKYKYDYLIYNGIEKGDLSLPPTQVNPLISIPTNTTVVGTIGRIVPVKNHKNLIEAAAHVTRKHEKTIFLIVGDGPLLDDLRRIVARMGLDTCVIFTGHRSDISSILGIIDIFVLPSDEEGLPMALLEAMAEGIPAVATSVGGVPELVVDRSTGFLISPQNSAELAESICALIENHDMRKQMGKAARQRVEESFSVERMIKQYEHYYITLLSQKHN